MWTVASCWRDVVEGGQLRHPPPARGQALGHGGPPRARRGPPARPARPPRAAVPERDPLVLARVVGEQSSQVRGLGTGHLLLGGENLHPHPVTMVVPTMVAAAAATLRFTACPPPSPPGHAGPPSGRRGREHLVQLLGAKVLTAEATRARYSHDEAEWAPYASLRRSCAPCAPRTSPPPSASARARRPRRGPRRRDRAVRRRQRPGRLRRRQLERWTASSPSNPVERLAVVEPGVVNDGCGPPPPSSVCGTRRTRPAPLVDDRGNVATNAGGVAASSTA